MPQESALPALLLAFTDPVTSRTILEIYFFSLSTYLMFSYVFHFVKNSKSKTQAPCFSV